MKSASSPVASAPATISLTGATGFLGWHLAEAFRDAGWQVRAIVRPGSAKPLPEGVHRVEAALAPADAAALAAAIDGSALLVHNAGIIRAARPSAFDAVNVDGTRAVVEAANRAGARLILVSSQAAAGVGSPLRPSREGDPPRPLTAYGHSKLGAEDVVRSTARVPWTVLRPSAIYGPRDRGFLPLFRLASWGLFLQVARPSAAFTLTYVHDVVRAVVLAADDARAAGETLFVGHAPAYPAEALLQSLAAVFGRRYRPLRVPPAALRVAALAGELSWKMGRQPLIDAARLNELRAAGFVCAVDRARLVLGFSAAVTLPDGIERTAQWYRDQGWI